MNLIHHRNRSRKKLLMLNQTVKAYYITSLCKCIRDRGLKTLVNLYIVLYSYFFSVLEGKEETGTGIDFSSQ